MKKAIVIGATSGIGRALAVRLAAAGYRVGLVGRREQLLRALVEECPDRFRHAVADVSDPEGAVAALAALADALGGMDLCIVAAGTGELNPALDFAREEPTIRTNVVGWTAVVDWAYGCFERQGGGHLVAITSVGGVRGAASAPAYNASKAYQINYMEALRGKAFRAGRTICVTDIRPGLVDTEMAKGEGLFWVMPVGKVVRQILRAIRRRKAVAVVTHRWRAVAWLLRHLPGGLYVRIG